MVYICARLLQLAVESRDLAQAVILSEKSCHFCELAQLVTTVFFSQLEINHVFQQPTEAD